MHYRDLVIPVCDLKYKEFPEMSPLTSKCGAQTDVKENLPQNNGTNVNRRSPRRQMKVKEESEEEDEDYKEKPVRRKLVKVIDFKPEDESSDSEEEIPIIGSRKRNGADISEYEKMIERNRAESLAFLKSLKVEEAKAGLMDVVNTIKKKKVQPVKRAYRQVEKTSPPVLRKSKRLANISVDLSEDALFSKAIKESKMEQSLSERKKQQKSGSHLKFIKSFATSFTRDIKDLPPKMSFKEALQFGELYENYVKDVSIQESQTECKFASYDKSVIKNLTLDMANIAKITPSRITSLAWYPSPDCLVLAAGSKYGNLGIWNVDSESSPYVFTNHTAGTTNLQFNPLNRVQLVSSSYDGTLRLGDMVKHTFDEIYNISELTSCTYFDFLSQSTYLVAQRNGQVALVDNRTEGKRCEKKHSCHEYSIKTVNVHPVNKNFFVTAENKGCIRLWDLRKLQKEPVADITHHKRCVQSAFFSPVTGNLILATSADDTVSIFDSTNLTKDIKLKQQMKHNNFTGRWLSVFKATWLPNSEEAFVIGSMQEPRRIQVYNANMDVCHIIMHENLTTVSSTNSFHPCRRALAGGNSSGKVFVFT